MNPKVKQLANEYKAMLQKIYGQDFIELILFGSYARGDFNDESDIDFAIVLKKQPLNSSQEIQKISPIGVHLELKYGMMVSTFPMSFEMKKSSMQSFYQDIRNEGIVI